VNEQSLQHDLDVLRLTERALDPRAPPARTHNDEIAGADVSGALAVDLNRNVRNEVRLAEELLAALLDLDD
jgi:hypothetical protein